MHESCINEVKEFIYVFYINMEPLLVKKTRPEFFSCHVSRKILMMPGYEFVLRFVAF